MAKAKKYAAVLAGREWRPELIEGGEDRRAKVMKVRAEQLARCPELNLLVKEYTRLRAQKEAAEERLSAVNLELEALCRPLMDMMESQGMESVKLTGVGTVRMDVEPQATVTDPAAVREWCLANGLENSMTLPWQTLNSLCKEYLLQGEPTPPGVQIWPQPKLVYTRG